MNNKKLKIFVTTGSVLEFDCLVKIIDNINKDKRYDIICQIGNGKYIPRNLKHFKFTNNINKYYSWADLIITHTGVGTIIEICSLNKKAIAISNPKAKDNHELVKKFHKEGYLLYIPFEDIENNEQLLNKKIIEVIKNKTFKKYIKKENNIGKEILKYLKNY